jgi:hypothetical protein
MIAGGDFNKVKTYQKPKRIRRYKVKPWRNSNKRKYQF